MITMFPTRSAKLVNAVINHPDVRPTFEQGSHYLDSGSLLMEDRNVVFVNSYGVVIFVWRRPGVYEGHMAFLQAGRGATAVSSVRSAIEGLFARPGAQKLVAAVPLQLRAARLVCRMLGFTSLGEDLRQEHFVLEKGAGHGRTD